MTAKGVIIVGAKPSKSFTVIASARIDATICRIIEFPDGSGQVQTWRGSEGWQLGGASLDEFLPGAALPISRELRERMGCHIEDLAEDDQRYSA